MSDEKKERYKLQEAAEILAQGNKAGAKKILRNLKKSVRDGDLKVFYQVQIFAMSLVWMLNWRGQVKPYLPVKRLVLLLPA
jgi:hypothetical protein